MACNHKPAGQNGYPIRRQLRKTVNGSVPSIDTIHFLSRKADSLRLPVFRPVRHRLGDGGCPGQNFPNSLSPGQPMSIRPE